MGVGKCPTTGATSAVKRRKSPPPHSPPLPRRGGGRHTIDRCIMLTGCQSTLTLDNSHLGEMTPQGTSETQNPVTFYAFNAQSELPAYRRKQWLNAHGQASLATKVFNTNPESAHSNIDNTLAPRKFDAILTSSVVVCRAREHQHRWHINVQHT